MRETWIGLKPLIQRDDKNNILFDVPYYPRRTTHCYASSAWANKQDFEERIRHTVDLCKQLLPFDYVACTGLSGVLMAPAIAREMDKMLIVCRKSDETEHHGRPIEMHYLPCARLYEEPNYDNLAYYYTAFRYIVVDDCTCSGRTIGNIRALVEQDFPNAKYRGTVLYDDLILRQPPTSLVESYLP